MWSRSAITYCDGGTVKCHPSRIETGTRVSQYALYFSLLQIHLSYFRTPLRAVLMVDSRIYAFAFEAPRLPYYFSPDNTRKGKEWEKKGKDKKTKIVKLKRPSGGQLINVRMP